MNQKIKEDYSFKMHFGLMFIGSLTLGLFTIMAGFSSNAIFGGFIIGGFLGELLGIIANWVKSNA